MATKKPIISVIVENQIYENLKQLSEKKNTSLSKLASNLLLRGLYLEDELKYSNLVDEILEDQLCDFLLEVLDMSPDPIWIKDKNLRHIYVNKAFANLFGMKKEDIIGKTDIDAMSEEEAKMCVYTDMIALQKEEPYIFEEVIEGKEGKIVFEVIKKPVKDKYGSVIALLGIARDITKLKECEKIRQ